MFDKLIDIYLAPDESFEEMNGRGGDPAKGPGIASSFDPGRGVSLIQCLGPCGYLSKEMYHSDTDRTALTLSRMPIPSTRPRAYMKTNAMNFKRWIGPR